MNCVGDQQPKQKDTTLPSIDEASRVFRECAGAAILSSACLRKTGDHLLSVHSSWNQRDLERESVVKFGRTHIATLTETGNVVGFIDPGSINQLNAEQLTRWSPSGKLKAVLRQVKNKKGEEKQYIEVWNSNNKIRNVDISVLEKHGNVYADGEFGCFEWSSDESRLLYIAEKKQPETVSYFHRKISASPNHVLNCDLEVKCGRFEYRQDWGEEFRGKHHPVPCILDIEKETVTIPEGLPDGVSAGQAVWTPDYSGIVFTGWQHEPCRIGLLYSRRRRNAIYHLDLRTGNCHPISVTDHSVWSPRFSPDGSKLVYFKNRCYGVYVKYGQVMLYDWNSKEKKLVLDTVQRPTEDNPFPGVYTARLVPRCWVDNERIILSSYWRSKRELIVVNTATGDVTRVTNDKEFGNWVLCDTDGSIVLACRSSPINSGQLVIGVLPSNGHEASITWKPLHESSVNFTDVEWSLMKLNPKPCQDCDRCDVDFEAIVIQPKRLSTSDVKPPLLVWPHGGPDAIFVSDYFLKCIPFCRLGFVTVQVNYRGSVGFCQASLESIQGNIGQNDVQDIHTTCEEIVKRGLADPERVVVCGGSHGGTIALQMACQYPDFYKVCLLRNPATDLAAMLGGTDIPSWPLNVSGFDFDFEKAPSAEMYATMFSKSPIALIEKMKAPTLFLTGRHDVRVPPGLSRRFHQILKARGVKSKLIVYPDDGHLLNSVGTEADCFMSMYDWTIQHI